MQETDEDLHFYFNKGQRGETSESYIRDDETLCYKG